MKAVAAFFILAVCLPAVCLAAQDENLTITTYYPSPHGVYRSIRFYPSAPPDCLDASDEGLMYYNSTDLQRGLRLCIYNGTGYSWTSDFGGGDSGDWQKDPAAGSINNTNLNGKGNVSIGTNDAEATLTTYRADNAAPGAEIPLTGAFGKHRAGDTDQWLAFAEFPPGTGYAPYLNRTSMIYASTDRPWAGAGAGNLKAAAADNTSTINFLVGSNYNPNAETMRIGNPCYGGAYPCPRVSIGNTTPQFPLTVEANTETGPLMVRAATGALKSGIFNIAPVAEQVYLAFGCYLMNPYWYNDPYEYPAGTLNHYGMKFVLNQTAGAVWNSYDDTYNNDHPSWNVAYRHQLWDPDATWRSTVKLPSVPTGAITCDGAHRGAMIFNSTDKIFCGCTASGWRRLNN